MKYETYMILSMVALSIVSFIPHIEEIPICMTMLSCTYWIVRAIESKK